MKGKDIEVVLSSFHLYKNNYYFISKIKNRRYLTIASKREISEDFKGKKLSSDNINFLICPLSSENADGIRNIFPQHKPQVFKKNKLIFGMGYRSPYLVGNIVQAKVINRYPEIYPVLAQQSKRECERTKRSFKDILNSATWASFETNLNIWSADADHLKKPSDAIDAAKLGFTHFTIDPSDVLVSSCKKEIKFRNIFPLIYNFIKTIKKYTNNFTLELSLDEGEDITSQEEFIYILEELKKKGIKIDEIAPKFLGCFEKGIDYFSYIKDEKKIRNLKLFEEHFSSLYKIAKRYGVRLCLHSGSDKFSIYPVVRKVAGKNIHIKTAGTFFLEELRLVAKKDPYKFMKIYKYALSVFENERKSYKLTTEKKGAPKLDRLTGEEIYKLTRTRTGNDTLRQILHVCYGKVLTHPYFRKVMEEVVISNEDMLFKLFYSHIKKHLKYFL